MPSDRHPLFRLPRVKFCWRKGAALGRDEGGATAVEFAFVALPFFALMFAILETGLVFFAGQTLETSVSMAGRLVRTGQAQDMSLWDFRNEVCGLAGLVMNCQEKLVLQVQVIDSFSDADFSPPRDEDGNLQTESREDQENTFVPGGPEDIVVVSAFYEWPVYARLLGFNLANTANGTHLLVAATAFRNEPFP